MQTRSSDENSVFNLSVSLNLILLFRTVMNIIFRLRCAVSAILMPPTNILISIRLVNETSTVRPRPRPRPESARPRSRPRPRPKICYETETENYETETETETSPVKSIAGESNTNRYVSFFYYTREVNDEPEIDFAFKMISE